MVYMGRKRGAGTNMKPGDLVTPKYPKDTSPAFEIEPELVLELDYMDDIAAGHRYGRRYVFWKVLRGDGTVGKLCDVLDEESCYEVMSCGLGI